jgi:glycosyltransferase involved in cell wall biosynthesis
VKRECNPFYYEYELVGETSRSWLILAVGADAWMKCDLKRYAQKLPKNGKGYEFGTKQSMEMAEWAGKYRYNIGQLVGCLSDPHMLATIARMIGFKNLLEDNHEGSEGSSQGN